MPFDPPSLLLRKAQDDERLALLILDNPAVSDEQIGFQAQQAVEKAIKAVLSHNAIAYRRTHDLAELIDLLKAGAIRYPALLDESTILTPFAAEMRYDYLPPEKPGELPLDRRAVMRIVRAALEWAAGRIG
jgi:HEPN domain-containing protein